MAAMEVGDSLDCCKSEVEPELEEILKEAQPTKSKPVPENPSNLELTPTPAENTVDSGQSRLKRKIGDASGPSKSQVPLKTKKTMRRRSKVGGKRLYNL